MLQEKWGVSAAAADGGGRHAGRRRAPPAAAGPPPRRRRSSTSCSWRPARRRIQVIKVVRELHGPRAEGSKDLVDGAPKPVKEKVAKAEADDMKKKLEEQGATVQVK